MCKNVNGWYWVVLAPAGVVRLSHTLYTRWVELLAVAGARSVAVDGTTATSMTQSVQAAVRLLDL